MTEFTETSGVFQKQASVSDTQTDAFGRMTPGALARLVGDATAEHMTSLGLNYNTLRSHGLLWVLVRTALRVQNLPRQGERVLLCTWAGEERHWLYPRRTTILSSEGEELVSACSQWMLIDTDTRSMASPSELLQSVPVISFPDEPKLPSMRVSFPTELTERAERVVRPREIDLNGHMNNSHYLDWGEGLLGSEYLRNHSLRFFWVEYGKELFEGQNVSLHYKQEKDSLFLRGYTEGDTSFSLKMDYTELRLLQ